MSLSTMSSGYWKFGEENFGPTAKGFFSVKWRLLAPARLHWHLMMVIGQEQLKLKPDLMKGGLVRGSLWWVRLVWCPK